MKTDPRSITLQALEQMRGDDTIRARAAFRGFNSEEMKKPHGQSGQSRAEILRSYEARDADIDSAIAWVKRAS